MKISIDDLKFKFKFKENDNMPAIMTLIIGQFEVRGFKVLKTQFEENRQKFVIYPPSKSLDHNKWLQLFWTEDKEDWNLLCKKALEQFDKEHTDWLLEQTEKQQTL